MADLLNTGLQTTEKQLYILNVENRERLEIQFVPPSLDIDRDSEQTSIKIVGRNTPKYQDAGGGETTVSLTLDFYADEEKRTSVLRKCNWLQALTYTDRGKKATPRVALIFGEIFKRQIWKVKSVKPKISDFSKPHGFMPKQAYVDIVLCLDVDYNIGWEDVNVSYPSGAPDGSMPFVSSATNIAAEDQKWKNITRGNSFEEILRRAFANAGLLGNSVGNF